MKKFFSYIRRKYFCATLVHVSCDGEFSINSLSKDIKIPSRCCIDINGLKSIITIVARSKGGLNPCFIYVWGCGDTKYSLVDSEVPEILTKGFSKFFKKRKWY